jgi:DNA-binding transcriptional ArsR family regulator
VASAQQQPFVQQPSQQSQSQSANRMSSLLGWWCADSARLLSIYRWLSISAGFDIVQPMTVSADPDVRFLQALADPVRLSIVRQIASSGSSVCACDFTECCVVSQPTVSHHLKVLRESGVVTSERQGTNIIYSLAPDFEARWAGIGAGLKGLVTVG